MRLRRAASAPELVGCWQLVRSADESAEPAEADFRPDGRLIHSMLSGDRWQVIRLVYEVRGDTLITDQPSSPRREKTRFVLEPDGTLMLEFGGQRSWFKRGPKQAPDV